MKTVEILPCGDDALRLVTPEPETRHALAGYLLQTGRWQEVVIGRSSVTVLFDPVGIAPSEAHSVLRAQISSATTQSVQTPEPVSLRISTQDDDAPDLDHLAQQNRLTKDIFMSRLKDSPLVVDMLGFAPGFAYVAGADAGLRGARLEHPRQSVPAGSVGFIEGYLGIYALDGPGGWPIIGHTDAPLFDVARDPPFLLTAGTPIRIEWV
jgi:allophanate hydrolase